MLDEHVPFLEGTGIEQHLEPFARRELAFGVLLLDAPLPAAEPRGSAFLFELPQNVRHFDGAPPRLCPVSVLEQVGEPFGQPQIVAQSGAALGLLRVFAPSLDLEAFVELGRSEGSIGVEAPRHQRERDRQ